MKKSALLWKNLIRKPGRTLALALLTAFLSLSVFGGSLVILSLRSGVNSLEARLGADIIVIPATARSKVDPEEVLLQGTTGAFYMSDSVLEKIEKIDGVEKTAAQVFLATLKADCCSSKIQVIGFDPAADFTVQPWIGKSFGQALEEYDLVVGSKISAEVGERLKLYGVSCPVAARLSPTGTGFDTAVYCNFATIDHLLAAAEEKGVSHKIDEGGGVISAVYVKVRDGYDVGSVSGDINAHVRKVSAIRTKNMITGVSDSLAAVSSTVTLLMGAVWALSIVILWIAYAMIANERKREFAVLRLAGASRAMLSGMVLKESLLCSLLGGLLGVGAACAVAFPFAALIEISLDLPYLTPPFSTVAVLAGIALAATAAVGALSGAGAALRLSRTDPGTVLREGG